MDKPTATYERLNALVHEVCDRAKFFEKNENCFRCAREVDTPHGKGMPGCYAAALETVSIVRRAEEALSGTVSETAGISVHDPRWTAEVEHTNAAPPGSSHTPEREHRPEKETGATAVAAPFVDTLAVMSGAPSAARQTTEAENLIDDVVEQAKDWWTRKSHCPGEMRELGVPDDADIPPTLCMGDLYRLQKAIKALSSSVRQTCASGEECMDIIGCWQGQPCLRMSNGYGPAPRSAIQTPITDNDKRWRFLEHGCQWVSWIAHGKDQVSFDPRKVTGYGGHLQDMRATIDRQCEEQLALLKAEAARLNGKLK